MAGALLVADEDVVELLRPVDRIVEREYRSARKSEDDVGAEFLQGPDDGLGAVDALGASATTGGGDSSGTGA
jgi:hypothetical protein